MASFLDSVPLAQPDPIFLLTAKCKADTFENKVDLGVGAYRDENGKPWVLPVVKKAETRILGQLEDGSINHEYLPIGGLQDFVDLSVKFALGDSHPAIASGRAGGVQGISGTGSLRIAGEFINEHGNNKDIFVSDPTWGNHHKIMARAGLTVHKYRYYNPGDRGLDLDSMLADLSAASVGATVVLHACAHNPTGVDASIEQWQRIADVVVARKLFVLFDSAYQGFASGDPDNDAKSIRLFAELGIPFFVCQSYSKNFGLYNERAGCIVVCSTTPEAVAATISQLKLVIRQSYSNPPSHGARIVAAILGTPELYAEWRENLNTMSQRIIGNRHKLLAALTERKTPGDWSHITKHIGMFTFTGLTPKQVSHCTDKFHIYMLASGRVNMCGLNDRNIPFLADAIHDAVSTIDSSL